MKKVITLLIGIFILFVSVPVNASTNTFDRNTLDNYGVNKNWKITEEKKKNILNTPAVNAAEKIYDFANILTDEEETEIKERIDKFIQKTKMDMVIVTDQFAYINDSENEDYASDFYDYNDFGIEYENNSGVLFFRNNNESNPYYGIYTFGNTQLFFLNNREDDILDSIYSDIHSENYLTGILSFIEKAESYITESTPKEMDNYYVDETGHLQRHPDPYRFPWAISGIISLVVTIIIMSILIHKNKMVKKAYEASEYLKKESVKIDNRKDQFITSKISSYKMSSDSGGSGGHGGGFSSHTGSSGGGHSGGGRHG